MGAACALIMTGSFSTDQFLLNGMAISFITEFDTMVSYFLLDNRITLRIQDHVYNEIKLGHQSLDDTWLGNRLYGFYLVVIITIQFRCMEWFLNGNCEFLQFMNFLLPFVFLLPAFVLYQVHEVQRKSSVLLFLPMLVIECVVSRHIFMSTL